MNEQRRLARRGAGKAQARKERYLLEKRVLHAVAWANGRAPAVERQPAKKVGGHGEAGRAKAAGQKGVVTALVLAQLRVQRTRLRREPRQARKGKTTLPTLMPATHAVPLTPMLGLFMRGDRQEMVVDNHLEQSSFSSQFNSELNVLANYLKLLREYSQLLSDERNKQSFIEEYIESALPYEVGINENALFIEAEAHYAMNLALNNQILYSGFLFSLYSFVERQLLGLCEALELKIVVRARDYKRLGSGIYRAYHFLKRAYGYEIGATVWQEIRMFARLRNFLIHSGFNILTHDFAKSIFDNGDYERLEEEYPELAPFDPLLNEQLESYLRKHNLLDVVSTGEEIVLRYDYCDYLLEFVKASFAKICKDIDWLLCAHRIGEESD